MEPLVRDLTPLLKAERTTRSDIAVNTGRPNMRDNADCGEESVLSYTLRYRGVLLRTFAVRQYTIYLAKRSATATIVRFGRNHATDIHVGHSVLGSQPLRILCRILQRVEALPQLRWSGISCSASGPLASAKDNSPWSLRTAQNLVHTMSVGPGASA
jgi:hypothetical protein